MGTVAGISAGVGVAASLAGAGVQYVASSNAASAAADANNQTIAAQNTAFEQRLAAQNAQTAEQASVQDTGQSAYLAAESKMRSDQSQALTDKQTALAKMNQQEANIQDTTTQQVQDTTQNQVTAQSLAAAQAQSEAQRNAAITTPVADIKASNPTAPTASNVTKSAMAEEMGRAADYSQTYGQNLARLSAYSAPLQTANIAQKELATNLMPSASADTLLKAGVNARLLPSDTAYTNATTLGNAAIASNTQRVSDEMSLAKMRESYASNYADLQQSDTNANIQTGLNYAQAKAATLKSIGSGISSVGNAAVSYGAATGGFGDIGNTLGFSDSGFTDQLKSSLSGVTLKGSGGVSGL